jgi:Na+/pantothenate symporter
MSFWNLMLFGKSRFQGRMSPFPQRKAVSKSMKPATTKALTSFGWLFLFAFLTLGVVGSINPKSLIASLIGFAVFGTMSFFWLRLAFQTLKKWSGATAAIAGMVVLLAAQGFFVYVGWLGATAK